LWVSHCHAHAIAYCTNASSILFLVVLYIYIGFQCLLVSNTKTVTAIINNNILPNTISLKEVMVLLQEQDLSRIR